MFDFGGVLTTPVWDSFASFCEAEGLDPGAIKSLFRSDPEALALLRRLETGSIGDGEFEGAFGAKLGISGTDGLIDRMFAEMQPLEPMVELVRALGATQLSTGLVSNSWSTGHYDRELLDALFDFTLISGEIGLHKPQREIYERAAAAAGVEPEACIFVDDLAENCEGAEAVGMTAVRHREPAPTIARLRELTGLELGAVDA